MHNHQVAVFTQLAGRKGWALAPWQQREAYGNRAFFGSTDAAALRCPDRTSLLPLSEAAAYPAAAIPQSRVSPFKGERHTAPLHPPRPSASCQVETRDDFCGLFGGAAGAPGARSQPWPPPPLLPPSLAPPSPQTFPALPLLPLASAWFDALALAASAAVGVKRAPPSPPSQAVCRRGGRVDRRAWQQGRLCGTRLVARHVRLGRVERRLHVHRVQLGGLSRS